MSAARDDPPGPPGKPLAVVLAVLGVLTLATWLIVAFVSCRHAGLV